MKKNVKILVGAVVGVAVISAAYFGAGGGMFQGKISMSDTVSRGELIKIITGVMGGKLNDFGKGSKDCFFSGALLDVPYGSRYYDYVCYMVKKNLIPEPTYLDIKGGVTRAEAAKLFVDAFDKVKDPAGIMAFSGDVSKLPAPYSDVVDSSPWYFFPVYRAASLKIADMKGFIGAEFLPNNLLTKRRAQYWADNLNNALNK